MREHVHKYFYVVAGAVISLLAWFVLFGVDFVVPVQHDANAEVSTTYVEPPDKEMQFYFALPEAQTVGLNAYDKRMLALAHLEEYPDVGTAAEAPLWPVTDTPYPKRRAILPFKRIVAYYGNFYSRYMGILGEFSEEVVLDRLAQEVAKWEEADPDTPVMPAIDYISSTAQLSPGKDGYYRLRMPDEHVQKAIDYAEKIDGIVILEVQPGLAPLQPEIEYLEKWLKMPQVHLAIDPEFVMIKTGSRPGIRVGTVDATDVNTAAEYLARLVQENNLPPKVLVVHRYTRPMVTNATDIKPLPEVQIVMDMDGWGMPQNKYGTYNAYIASEPVQFTGFKLFYKNDTKYAGSRLLTPEELLELVPKPIFIQYQ